MWVGTWKLYVYVYVCVMDMWATTSRLGLILQQGLECSSLMTEIDNRDRRIQDILNEKEKMEKVITSVNDCHSNYKVFRQVLNSLRRL